MPVTIKDISKEAGVSIAAVSKVINGDYSNVSSDTKNKILRIAKELNYRPNRLARGLVSNRTNIIGLIVPDIANPYFAELAKGIENNANKFGYKLILCNTDEDVEKANAYIDVLFEYNVDGVIISGSESSTSSRIQQLHNSNVPVVAIDGDLGAEAYNVYAGNLEGSFIATEHIIQSGHKLIAFIGGDGVPGRGNLRLDGYLKAMRQYEISVNYDLIKLGNYQMETGYLYTKLLIESGQPFTSIVCGNDMIAFGALNAIKDKGLRVPKDISLIGYDDIYLTTMMEPKLSTIKQPLTEISSYAVEVLVKLMQKEEAGDKVKCFVPHLVCRDSVQKLDI
ncbi:LacI family transcriptional regulator [Paenibacillus taihuensis]|uniref:LacI family transcriptional regulator n=1 Tax=Paenibacillus taihuensis TaxID=1156355 RepID=A0A3D9Q6H1_9BACL|nr:LacI family DNA-binding transcriptional regulator [Paenibacillus taihuensis]REE56444.1 LacI family transcriptional regulator [Paenibacillus taihuensis]